MPRAGTSGTGASCRTTTSRTVLKTEPHPRQVPAPGLSSSESQLALRQARSQVGCRAWVCAARGAHTGAVSLWTADGAAARQGACDRHAVEEASVSATGANKRPRTPASTYLVMTVFRVGPRLRCDWTVPLGPGGAAASRGGEEAAAQQAVAGAATHGLLHQPGPVDVWLMRLAGQGCTVERRHLVAGGRERIIWPGSVQLHTLRGRMLCATPSLRPASDWRLRRRRGGGPRRRCVSSRRTAPLGCDCGPAREPLHVGTFFGVDVLPAAWAIATSRAPG